MQDKHEMQKMKKKGKIFQNSNMYDPIYSHFGYVYLNILKSYLYMNLDAETILQS